jgi:hypothetical protein
VETIPNDRTMATVLKIFFIFSSSTQILGKILNSSPISKQGKYQL